MKIDKSSPIPRFYQLAEIFETKLIRNRSYKDEMLPPIEKLATEYDVSKATVNKAIKILTDKGLLYGEVGRGTYIRKDQAQTRGRVKKIVLVADGSELALKVNYFTQSLHHAIEQQCKKNAIEFEFLALKTTGERSATLSRLETPPRPGFIFINRHADTEWLWSELDKTKTRYTCILTDGGTDLPEPVQQVATDEVNATRLCLRHLIKLGHRNIAYLGRRTPDGSRKNPVRYDTMAATFKRYKIPVREELIVDSPTSSHDTRICGYEAMQALLARNVHFTAVFTVNDLVAAGAILCLKDHGIRVPEDISVVGHDDDPYSSHFAPSITTVHMDYAELGRRAFFSLLNRDDSAAMKYKLIARESSAPVQIRKEAP